MNCQHVINNQLLPYAYLIPKSKLFSTEWLTYMCLKRLNFDTPSNIPFDNKYLWTDNLQVFSWMVLEYLTQSLIMGHVCRIDSNTNRSILEAFSISKNNTLRIRNSTLSRFLWDAENHYLFVNFRLLTDFPQSHLLHCRQTLSGGSIKLFKSANELIRLITKIRRVRYAIRALHVIQ